jgi:formylglycine-generating enzyme required for sulfatase activity
MNKHLMLMILLAAFSLPMFANNIALGATTLTNENSNEGCIYVTFDVTWENSWRLGSGAPNWDAAWLLVKYRVGGTGEWLPAHLHNTGHVAGSGTAADITVGLVDADAAFNASTNPGIGAFVCRSGAGSGTFTNTGLQLRWDYDADGIAAGANVEVKVFAIEMVRVLEGDFNAGGGGGNSAFTSTTISTANATTAPEGAGSLGGEAGGYPTGQTAPDNASWPNGYNAFYCMKYEVTQQQYVDFLNTLTQTQADARKYTLDPLANRYAITGTAVGSYATTNPNVACNFLGWADDAAYADWSGLRPMTELEFEKACRGDQPAIAGEYAWGTADVANSIGDPDNYYTLSNAGASNEGIATNYSTTAGNAMYSTTQGTIDGPVRVGLFAANGSNSGRLSAGASYWGIMELSGNLWERPVTIDNATGRAFTGTHGDGVLDSNGDANAATWPGTDAVGAGWRGGSWIDAPYGIQVSDRVLAGDSYSDRIYFLGFRAVRR